jgi:hypothetical protein|tara:strand:+ start:772 stop:999 length:228 start_codon:yes stop_codon:yes gene_type:complete
LTKIAIDNVEYDREDFSNELSDEIHMLEFTERRIAELQRDIACYQTAKNGYSIRVRELLIRDHGHSTNDVDGELN